VDYVVWFKRPEDSDQGSEEPHPSTSLSVSSEGSPLAASKCAIGLDKRNLYYIHELKGILILRIPTLESGRCLRYRECGTASHTSSNISGVELGCNYRDGNLDEVLDGWATRSFPSRLKRLFLKVGWTDILGRSPHQATPGPGARWVWLTPAVGARNI
jgi:hypothetical protein